MPVITQSTYDIVKDFGVPFASLMIGFFAGIKSNLYIAKRAEFNSLAANFYISLRQQIDTRSLCVIDINTHILEHYIPIWKRRDFRIKVKAYQSYGNSLSEYVDGEVIPNQPVVDAFIKDAQKLLPFFSPR